MKTLTSIVLALAVVVPAAAGQNVDETRPAARDGVVTISILAGSVKVEGWTRDEIHVTGTLEQGVERLEISAAGRRTRIETVLPDNCRRCEADLVIQVPAGSRVEVKTVSAGIDASGLSGALDAHTVSGGIRVSGSPSDLRAESVSGALDLDTGRNAVDARSVSGRITLRSQAASLHASTVSGRLEVHAGDLERGSFGTVAGAVRVEAGVAPQGRIDVETVTGAVTLALPPGIAADFHVATFSGTVENAFGPAAELSRGVVPGTELAFSTGGGGGRISVETFSGPVSLQKR